MLELICIKTKESLLRLPVVFFGLQNPGVDPYSWQRQTGSWPLILTQDARPFGATKLYS